MNASTTKPTPTTGPATAKPKKRAPFVQTCGSCRFWNPEVAKNKAGKVRPDVPVRCTWKAGVFPTSVPNCNIVPNYMRRDDGDDCACWEGRDAAAVEPATTVEALAAQVAAGNARLAKAVRVEALLHEAYPHLRGAPRGIQVPRRVELLAEEIAQVIDVGGDTYHPPTSGR